MNDNLLNLQSEARSANTNTIAATTTSQTRELPNVGGAGGGPTIVIYNDGPSVAFISWGSAGVVAVAPTLSTNVGVLGSTPIPVGQSLPFQPNAGDNYWAAVSLITSNVYCTRGDGR